jgi:hypothetical protein
MMCYGLNLVMQVLIWVMTLCNLQSYLFHLQFRSENKGRKFVKKKTMVTPHWPILLPITHTKLH